MQTRLEEDLKQSDKQQLKILICLKTMELQQGNKQSKELKNESKLR